MNILFISNDPGLCDETSAVCSRLRSYAEEVAKNGGAIHVLALGRGKPGKDLQLASNLWVHERRSRSGVLSFVKGVASARELIRLYDIDVVSTQNPFEFGWIGARAIRGTNARLHVQVHTDYLSPWFTRGAIYRSPRVRMPLLNHIRVRLGDYVVPRAHGIRTVSRRIKDSMMNRYGTISEPSVIPIAVSTDVPPKVELPPRPFTFTLFNASRLEPEKRIPDLLAAVKRLKDAYPALGLVLAGDGSERKNLEKLARAWGISDRVVFLGWRDDARGLVQSANAFIQASAYEGYGIALIEAALAGVPIITSDVGIVGEVFTGYENIFAAPVGDPTNLAALTAQLIEDPQARTLLSIEGKRAALAHLASAKNAPADIVADLARALQ